MSDVTPPVPSYAVAPASRPVEVGWTLPITRPLRGIAVAARWLVLAAGVVALLLAGIEAFGLYAMNEARSTAGPEGLEALYAHYLVSLQLGKLLPTLVAAAGICWFIWQYRAAAAATVSSAPPRRAPVWHVVSWLLPVICLWFPFQNVKDLAHASRAPIGHAVLGWWWALWILALIASQVSIQVGLLPPTPETNSAEAAVSLLTAVLLASAAPLAWLIVGRITDALQPATR